MRMNRFWALAALPFALAACGGDDDVDGDDMTMDTTSVLPPADAGVATTPMPGDTTMGAQGTTVAMNAVGGSGVSGQAQIMDHGQGQTMVMVNLTGQGSSTHSGHIHQGTCDSPGEVVVPLEDVTLANGTGSSTSTVNVPMADVMNGQHIVAYHASSGASPGAPVVCGAIPAQGTTM